MCTLKRLIVGSLFLFVLAGTALTQENRAPIETPREPIAPASAAPLVTAAATAERVRFVSPGTVVQLRLEVYNEAGQKLFDTELRGGNVLDWHLQDGAGQRLPTGSYACVLTIKSLSGRLSQRVGLVTVNDKEAAVETAGAAQLSQLSIRQQQTIGPVEGNATFTILQESEAEAITAVTHDGTEGQVARTRGALSFRVGDFFSGNDKEQMRLTEEGNVGIGTTKPKTRLDVAGMIRAREGFMFSDGSTLKVNDKGVLTRTSADGTAPSSVSSTQNRIAKFTDNAGTVGDSVAIDTGTGLQLTAPPSPSVDTNLIYLNSTNGTTGMLAGSTPSYGAANGPFFAMRGNTYSTIANQRGLFTIAAGNVTSPAGDDGSVKFNTGNDLLRMVIRPSGNVGVGVINPGSLLDVGGNINTSTQYNIAGQRVLSAPGLGPGYVGSFFAGPGAGIASSPGGAEENSFFGSNAGFNNVFGDGNAFFGTNAGRNSSGSGNSFFGANAGLSNTTEFGNTFVGRFSDGAVGITNATAIGNCAQVTQSNSLVLGSTIGGTCGLETKVGVGTTAPTERLEVVGNVKASGNLTVDTNTLHVDAANNRVGIGTTSPNTTLDLVGSADGSNLTGNANLFMRAVGATKGINFGVSGSSPNATLFIAHRDGATIQDRLIIHPDGTVSINTLAAATGVNLCINGAQIASCTSSLRYKERVAPLSAGLDLLSRLRPISFTWKGREERDLGLIAEEVEQVEPLLVTRNSAGEIQGVKYDQLSVVLINAVREQQAQIEEQRQQLQQKHLRIEKLETRLAALEAVVTKIGPGFNKRGETQNRRHGAGLRSRAQRSRTTRR